MRVLESNALQSPTPCTFRQLVNGMKETSGEMETNQNNNIYSEAYCRAHPSAIPQTSLLQAGCRSTEQRSFQSEGRPVYIEWKDSDSCTEIPERPMCLGKKSLCTTLNIRESNCRGSKIRVGILVHSGQLNNGQWPIYGWLVVSTPLEKI